MKGEDNMFIKHFGGSEQVTNTEDLARILNKRYAEDVNEFWITKDNQNNPCLVILVNKNLANVTYFPNEESSGFQCIGNMHNLNQNEFSVFYTNTLEEEIEISNSAIITFDKAMKIALDFLENRDIFDSIEWFEN